MIATSPIYRPEEHEPLVDGPWSEVRVRDSIAAIVADHEAAFSDGWPAHPADDLEAPVETLYLGTAGVLWALHRLGSTLDVAALVGDALERYRADPAADGDPPPPSLPVGETGILLVADVVGSPAADRLRLAELVAANAEHPTWELFYGSPGSILAARQAGLDHLADESARLLAEQWGDDGLWTQQLPGWTAQILGPAHGLAGNVHALRGWVSDAELRERVELALSATALRDDDLANWPPAVGSESRELRVQWCHGAPGIVTTVGDLMPLELALAGGELTWRAGPLAKGAGLCHGTAGNGWALLKLLAVTGDERWLERARRFAVHALAQVEAGWAELGRGRYSLFTGDVGVALFARACLDGDPGFPVLDVW